MQSAHGVSERRSRAVLNAHRRMVRYRSVKADQTPLLMPIRDLARVRVRYGYFRIYILLRREGWVVNRGASAVPRVRPEPPAQTAAPARHGGHAGGQDAGRRAERSLVDGLRVRHFL
ncbi:hypothetical protein GCM10008170_25770 [Methylopila capsulata]|uniref:Transposase n=1 Tax=Methylopila capsulata TaxID=61654 RepID=A0A9W6IUQ2_9HYPH|nr:hypothetical protein GCM10008170_25770 [Methylopila capsulata]